MIDDEKLYQALGQSIKRIRNSQNLNQDEFAKRIGLQRTSITNIESGKQNVTFATIYRICESFDIENILGLLPRVSEVVKRENTSIEQIEISTNKGTEVVGSKTYGAIQKRLSN